MDAALSPACDGDVDAGKTLHTRTLKDEERCAMDTAPLPSYNGDDDADKTARSRTTRARVYLAMGLALEVSATLWAFQQAVSAGALYGDVDCRSDGILGKLLSSSHAVDECDGQIDIDVFKNYSDTLTDRCGSYSSSPCWEEYVGCDSPTDAPTAQDDFEKRCTCDSVYNGFEYYSSCSWVALSQLVDEICYAQAVYTDSSDGDIAYIATDYRVDLCWPTNPQGSMALTITALVVALSSQLLEAFVGINYWQDAAKRTAPTLVASVFEALGVVAVSSVLLILPGFYNVSTVITYRIPAMLEVVWMSIGSVIAGALAEITAECSDRAAGRLPYLGAVGNGLIWLGAASLEVVVTSYLLWTGDGITNVFELVHESVGLIVIELLGLVLMWIARGSWTRAKLLRSVKCIEGPLGKRANITHFK